jgi:uncharacterized protein YdhG (YjbR/CyaY superfamily)
MIRVVAAIPPSAAPVRRLAAAPKRACTTDGCRGKVRATIEELARRPAMKDTRKPARRTTTTGDASAGFTDAERAAMKERARELKAASRSGAAKADGERDVLAKIAEMPDRDRQMAERLHGLVKAHAPGLSPKTWYGMPAYARDGKVICFFQSADKFKARYATLGFSDEANLDDGTMWPTSFALRGLTTADEARIAALLKKAVG